MAEVTMESRFEAIVLELSQLEGLAQVIAERVTGDGIDTENIVYLLAGRLKALTAECEAIEPRITAMLSRAPEGAGAMPN